MALIAFRLGFYWCNVYCVDSVSLKTISLIQNDLFSVGLKQPSVNEKKIKVAVNIVYPHFGLGCAHTYALHVTVLPTHSFATFTEHC